jgi:hypothetical protein
MRWIGEGIIKKDHTVFYSCQRRPHILKRLYYKPEDKTPYRLKQNHPECVDYDTEESFSITVSYVYMPQLRKE